MAIASNGSFGGWTKTFSKRERRPFLPLRAVVHHEFNRRDVRRKREPDGELGLDLLQDGVFLTLSDGQVRHDLGESAAIRRSLRPTISDRLGELPQLRVRPGDEMEHFRKPSASLEPQVKGRMAAQHVRESGVDERVYSALVEEREEHGDVGWDPGPG